MTVTPVFRAFAWQRPVGGGDTQPPTAPADLGAVTTENRVVLGWGASTDDVIVAVYRVYRKVTGAPGAAVQVAQTFATSWTDTVNVDEVTSFDYYVTAVDFSRNESAPSNTISVSVNPGPDTQAPTQPTDLELHFDPDTDELTVLWFRSTDNRGVLCYGVYLNGVLVGLPSSTSFTITLTKTGDYDVYVVAADAAGNLSPPSAIATIHADVGPAVDTQKPTVPTDLTVGYDGVDPILAWLPSTDNVGVTGYVVTRDGTVIAFGMPASFLGALTYRDTTAGPGAHGYEVEAFDAAQNHSPKTPVVTVTVPGTLVPPESISRAGITDVSAELQAWFDNEVPNGASVNNPTVVDLPSTAAYRIEDGLYLDRRKRITINGNGALLLCNNPLNSDDPSDPLNTGPQSANFRNRSLVTLRRCERMRWVNLRLRGARPSNAAMADFNLKREAQHGFWLLDGIYLDIVNCTITDTYGDLVNLERNDNTATIRGPQQVLVDGIVGRRAGRQSIALVCCTGVVIQNGDLSRCARAHFDLEPGNGQYDWVQDVIIQDMRTGPHQLNWLANWGGGRTNDILVQRNRCIGGPMQMELGTSPGSTRRRQRFSILDNFSDTPFARTRRYDGQDGRPAAIILVNNYDDVTVTGNDWPLSSTVFTYGVDFLDCTDATVANTLRTPLTAHPSWPGGDGQAKYLHGTASSTTLLGYSPSYSV